MKRRIPIHINPYLVAAMALAAFLDYLPQLGYFMAAVFWHEMCHAWTARMMGIDILEVELMPFGSVAKLDYSLKDDPSAEIIVSMAGPAGSFLFVLVIAALGYFGIKAKWLDDLLWCNLIIGVFNLLPALPLDGGAILRAALTKKMGGVRATKIASTSGLVLGALLTGLGVWLLFDGVIHVTLLGVGMLVAMAAWRQRRQAPYEYLTGMEHKRRSLARSGAFPVTEIAVREGTPVDQVMAKLKGGYVNRVLVLNDALGRRGIIEEADLISARMRVPPGTPIESLLH